jgi:aspartate-semialdehyde dehydrogenase
VTALASDRSKGEELAFASDSLEVEVAGPDSFRGMKVVLFAAPPEVARTLVPAAQAAGAWVVDVSAAFLADVAVPVVVSPINASAVTQSMQGRVVRCASPVTTALATVLEPLRVGFGLVQVSVTALLGASSAGHRGVEELQQQSSRLLSGRELEAGQFPYRLAFNLIPQVGPFAASGSTGEELGWRADLTRLWAGKSAALVDGTAIQVPTFFGHAVSITVKLGRGAEVGQVREALQSSAGLKLLDTPQEKIYPMPLLVTGDPAVLVGRVRPFAGQADTFSLFAVIDNAGRGAALSAVEVAELLAARG